MTTEEKIESINSIDENSILADGFEEALIGVAIRLGENLVIYDYEKSIDILMNRDGMDREGAIEFMSFNVLGAWVGDNTPIFIEKF